MVIYIQTADQFNVPAWKTKNKNDYSPPTSIELVSTFHEIGV